jgi:IS4 transposase
MVVVTIDTGKKLKLLTNDLDSPAETIADLYKTRCQIELFFRWSGASSRMCRCSSASIRPKAS